MQSYNIVKMPDKGAHKLITREKTLQAARDRLEYITRPYERAYHGHDAVVVAGATYAIFEG